MYLSESLSGQLEVVQFLHDGYTLFHPRYLNRNSVKLGRTWLVGEDSADFSGKLHGRSLLSKDILNGCRLPSKPLTENCIEVTSCFFFGGWRLPPKESSHVSHSRIGVRTYGHLNMEALARREPQENKRMPSKQDPQNPHQIPSWVTYPVQK